MQENVVVEQNPEYHIIAKYWHSFLAMGMEQVHYLANFYNSSNLYSFSQTMLNYCECELPSCNW